MKLYADLAEWWPVFAPPEVFCEQAERFTAALTRACHPRCILELGCGGGSVAYHLKQRFDMDLVDLSPRMLEAASELNPECGLYCGDMRSVRLEQEYDAVFVHDAIMYMTSERDLRQVMATAFAHLRPGGALLVAPEFTRETFHEKTETGGGDSPGRSGRYLAWFHDPDPSDTMISVEFALLLTGDGETARCVHDRHTFGLFPRIDWLRWLRAEGFQAEALAGEREMFLGKRPE